MLDDVSQLSRVALLAVHAPRRYRQAALVALLKTLLPKINKHGAAKRTTGNLVIYKAFRRITNTVAVRIETLPAELS